MSFTRHSHLIIAFLLLAFTSQLLANAAMTCEFKKATNVAVDHSHHHMSDMSMYDMTAMGAADHSTHSDQAPQQHHSSDCCKNMGHCAMGTCSLATANTTPIIFLIEPLSAAVDFYTGSIPSAQISSLYRPPIFS